MMKIKFATAAIAAIVSGQLVMSDVASARTHHHYHRRVYATHCSGGNGAVGTVAGGVGGALIGHAIAGGPVGTIAGGVGGALLGNHLDKQNTRHAHGCR